MVGIVYDRPRVVTCHARGLDGQEIRGVVITTLLLIVHLRATVPIRLSENVCTARVVFVLYFGTCCIVF